MRYREVSERLVAVDSLDTANEGLQVGAFSFIVALRRALCVCTHVYIIYAPKSYE